jgi:hypothetical protein
MKKHKCAFIVGLITALTAGVPNARADMEVSAGVQIHAAADFHAPLAPYGSWVVVGSYGRCWHPARLAVEWRPYCYGSWVYTDCGWYWVSDEPWAWACYHYGYWVDDAEVGWVWVPGVEWAPAWVEWRVGGGYIGWAPLAPRSFVVYEARPATFVFVTEARFSDPVRPSTVIINNSAVFNRTTVIAGSKHEAKSLNGAAPKQVVVNQGPSPSMVQKASGKTFAPMPIHEAIRHTPGPGGVSGESLKPTGRSAPPVAPNQPVPHSRGDEGKDRFGQPEHQPPGHGYEGARPPHPPREREEDNDHGHGKGGR